MTQNNKKTNPFPGIRSYQMDEDYLFFGRESQINELISILSETRFLAIIGSSGCGKSSLVRAGLIPSLLKGKMQENPNEWNINILRPGDNPIGNMARTIYKENFAEEKNIELQEIEKLLNSDNQGLVNVFKKLNKKSIKNQLIVIDQFEELFRFKSHKTSFNTIIQASNFVNLFLNAVNQRDVPIFVALSMRSDFLDDCTEYRNLTETINKGQYLVPRMTNEERKLAITGPIKVFDGKITDRLLERLLHDVGDDPDQLPILQHSLMRTWDYWKENKVENQAIDIQHYEAIGTMAEALSFHAEEIYNEFTSQEDKVIIEKFFKALTDFGTDNRGTRRPTQISEICTIANAKEDKVINIIEKFRASGRAFIMPPYNIPIDGDTTIDISHESIMRVWSRLKRWIQEETESAQLYLRLAKSAELYQQGKTGLWVNPELQVALKWQQQYQPNATWALRYNPAFDRTINFLEYSKKEFELEIAKKENRQKRDLKRARRFAIFLGSASIISLFFLIVSLNLRFKAEAKEQEALKQKQFAISEGKIASEQRKEAIIQKRISEQQQQIAEQQKILTEEQKQFAVKQQIIAINEQQKAISQKKKADIAKDEAIKAKSEADNQREEAITQKQLAVKAKTRAEISEKKTNSLRLIAIARSIAIKAAKIQKTSSGELPALLALQSYNFNKENNGNENDPDIYNALSSVAGKNIIFHQHKDNVTSVAISKNGYTLASCSDDGTVKLLNLNSDANQSSKNLKTDQYGKNGFRCVAFSTNGKILAAGSFEGKILLWNLTQSSPTLMKTISNHSSIVNDICFSKDGKYFASASSDGTVKLFNVNLENTSVKIIEKSNTHFTSVCYSPDGKYIAYGNENGRIVLRDITNFNETPVIIQAAGKDVRTLAFSKNGNILVSGNSTGSIRLWKMNNLKAKPVALIGHTSRISCIRFNPDGKTLATSSYDGTIRIWNYKKPGQEPIIIEGHDSWVLGIDFSPDGNKLVSSGKDKTIRMWITRSSILSGKICGKVSRNLSLSEWNKYIANDIKYEKTCTEFN